MSRDPYSGRVKPGDYHCPYCAPRPTRAVQGPKGEPHCAYCGDPLHREPHGRGRQLAAVLVISGFLAPLLSPLWLALQPTQPPRRPQPAERVALIWVAESQAPDAS